MKTIDAIHQRRALVYVKKQLAKALEHYIFEPAGVITQMRMQETLEKTLDHLTFQFISIHADIDFKTIDVNMDNVIKMSEDQQDIVKGLFGGMNNFCINCLGARFSLSTSIEYGILMDNTILKVYVQQGSPLTPWAQVREWDIANPNSNKLIEEWIDA